LDKLTLNSFDKFNYGIQYSIPKLIKESQDEVESQFASYVQSHFSQLIKFSPSRAAQVIALYHSPQQDRDRMDTLASSWKMNEPELASEIKGSARNRKDMSGRVHEETIPYILYVQPVGMTK
jgi:hypothetical protein